jgi:hypothetical protein
MELQRDGGGVGTQHDRCRFSVGKFNAFERGELSHRPEKSIADGGAEVKVLAVKFACYFRNIAWSNAQATSALFGWLTPIKGVRVIG